MTITAGPRARGAILLALVFAAGVLTGLATARVARPAARVGTRVVREVPLVFDSLALTAEQRRRVTEILDRSRPRTEALMREMIPRLDAITDSVDREIRGVLTPEQRAKLDAMRVKSPALVIKRKLMGDSAPRAETVFVRPDRP